MATVFVLAYRAGNDENANGPLGVYSTDALARQAGIREAQKDPNFKDRQTEWGPDQGWLETSWASFFVAEFEIDEEPEA